jgi:hypothetical protein
MVSHLKAQPNITLFSGFQGSGAYVWSPFVIKLEARLRFTGLSYRTEAGSLLKAPRGKIPYIAISRKDSDSQAPVTPTILGDSTLIAEKFVKEGVLDDLNAKLSPTEKAHDLALRALLEEKLYFYQVGVLVQMLSHAYRQLDFTCHQVQKLTLDYPTPRATKDGTRTITPRDHTFSQR